MICSRCLVRSSRSLHTRGVLSSQQAIIHQIPRSAVSFTTTAPQHSDRLAVPTSQPAQSTPQRHPPAATSTSAAQPFSTPLSSSPETANTPKTPSNRPEDASPNPQTSPPPPTSPKKQPPRQPSSVPAGAPLKGLNYFKNKPDPVAMEDDEYPEWLWGVLTTDKASAAVGATTVQQDPKLYSKSARTRRAAKKAAAKEARLHPESWKPKVPLFAQALDLPAAEGGVESANMADEARLQLRKAMRARRRNNITEANYLKGL